MSRGVSGFDASFPCRFMNRTSLPGLTVSVPERMFNNLLIESSQ